MYQGEQAVWLKAGRYEAVVLPDIGANLIAFRDCESGYRFLREPREHEMDSFKAMPYVHGIPVLFPPNRFEDGKFRWNGACYQFPVNEPERGNHLHGFVHNIPWKVEEYGTTDTTSYVSLLLEVDDTHPLYHYFPHTFTFRLRYTLSSDGLQQHTFIRNTGSQSMPCLLAYHTTVNTPFVPGSTASDYKLKMTIGSRREMNERMLPTGAFQPLKPEEEAMKTVGVNPFFEAMDNHYTAAPQNGRNRMELTDTRTGDKLVYDVGTSYKHWMIWNNDATEGFFCPEPQMNLVNAPNMDIPAEESGLIALESGEIWEVSARLYCLHAK
ncbi:aldose 1-epimerase [Paenibacillus sp. YYML68]|uniref:aldose 1-epimerase n=1 Tax=Paenibacillus sp. YYML68 TaxID=2909250 RepID=UPI00248F6429|nr:aldose 1-epimerase [Paenibacillus sp. YYML68]